MAHDIWKIPNLISLGRLLLLIPTAYCLSRPEPSAKLYALGFLTAAAISDYLDGYFARLLNQKTRLGLILDPLSDKILAGTLVVLLILYREFPIWLAGVIVGRDLLIALGGLVYASKLDKIPSSNLTGKYAFASIAVLLVSYVIEFSFGIRLLTVLTVPLIAISFILYARVTVRILKGQPPPEFQDRPMFRIARVSMTTVISAIYLVKLAQDIGLL